MTIEVWEEGIGFHELFIESYIGKMIMKEKQKVKK
jgi:hypothetical protein